MEYEVRPARTNYCAHLLTVGFLILAGGAFALSAVWSKLAVLFQSVGVLLLFPAIYLVGKYMAVQYLYRIRSWEDGNVDLEVYAYRGGTKMQLVCRIGLEEIKEAEPLSAANKRPVKGLKRYGYCTDLYPARALVLSVSNEDGDCEVLISYDEQLQRILSSAATPFIAE